MPPSPRPGPVPRPASGGLARARAGDRPRARGAGGDEGRILAHGVAGREARCRCRDGPSVAQRSRSAARIAIDVASSAGCAFAVRSSRSAGPSQKRADWIVERPVRGGEDGRGRGRGFRPASDPCRRTGTPAQERRTRTRSSLGG